MIIDCISDLHGHYPNLEGGDLLIVAGDLTARDLHEEYLLFNSWLNDSDYRKKIVIAGNHDNIISVPGVAKAMTFGKNIEYLCDSGTEFEGLKIWGSPWSKRFKGMNPKYMAFTVDTEEELAEKWALIPDDTDILVTHSPPWSMKDLISSANKRGGSVSLLRRLNEGKLNPKLLCFGHIHEGYGYSKTNVHLRVSPKMKLKSFECHVVNASHVTERYQPVNKPIRVEL